MDRSKTELTVASGASPSETIVLGLAKQTNVDPTEMPPLYETIDPEALDSLFQNRESGRVTFEYAGYEVVVARDDRVHVHETLTRSERGGDRLAEGETP